MKKQCPKCSRTYTDETLNYCLDDGERLVGPSVTDEPPTAVISGAPPSEAATRAFEPAPTARPAAEKSHARMKPLTTALAAIAFLSALAIGGYVYYSGRGIRQIDSIAVMPFVNESGNADVEYLSDGMTESLINSLSTLPNLSVKARNTVFRYKGKEIDERKVGQELSVQAVLFGRFIQRGDDLTLFLSLVDSATGNALWGEQYERKIQDLSALRNDIARDVAQKLRTRLSTSDTTNLTKNYTANAEALRLYFHGRYFWAKRARDSNRKAIEYFNQAIEKDPNFARAYSGLADAYVVPASGMAPRDAMPKAKAAALRALEIDDTLAEAHTSLARVLQVYDWNWAAAEKEFKRAIELDPRYPVAHQWYGGYLERIGRIDEAIAERKIALELDPLSAIAQFELAQAYYFARDYDRAIEEFQKTLEFDPAFRSALQYLAVVYALTGRYDEAIATARKMPESDNIFPGTAGQVYALAGRAEDARRVLDDLERRRERDYISPVTFALIHIPLGEKDKAMAWLEKGYEERAFQMQFLKLDPRFDDLRDDPRFADLVRRVGLPE